jgi:hypothetical protein
MIKSHLHQINHSVMRGAGANAQTNYQLKIGKTYNNIKFIFRQGCDLVFCRGSDFLTLRQDVIKGNKGPQM